MHDRIPDADEAVDDTRPTTARTGAERTEGVTTPAGEVHTQGLPPTPTQPLPQSEPAPAPQPWPTPMAPPGPAPAPTRAPMQAPVYPAAYASGPYGPVPQPMVTGKSSRPGLVLGVISLITSGIALLTAAGVALMMFGGSGFPVPPGDEGGWAPITGQLPFSPDGAQVSSGDLRDAITERMEEDDWYVERMECPHVPQVKQGVVSVCHATMDDGEWAIVVYFEDAEGTFTLQPL